MANRIITIYCADETMQKSSSVAGAAGSSNAVTLRLSFSSAWDGTTKKVYFYDATKTKSACIICTTDKLVTGETDVYDIPIPAEALDVAGKMLLTVKGVVVSGSTVERCMMSATTTMDVLRADMPNADTAPVEPTPTQSEQLQSEIDGIKSSISGASTKASEAAKSADSASQSASAASSSANAALQSSNDAASSQSSAAASKSAAAASASEAKTSETNAKSSETNAAASAGTATTQAGAAASSASAAKTSETNASTSETAAGGSASAAAASQSAAAGSASAAKTSELAAAADKTAAESAQAAADGRAGDAEAWAVGQRGGTDVNATDPTYHNNSKYYKEQAAAIVGGDYATKTEAQGYVDTHNQASGAHAALFKAQEDALATHAARTDNPHSVTKTQVGLGSADNTADSEKPVSTAQTAAIATAKSEAISTAESYTDSKVATIDMSAKADKKVPAAAGNIATLDSSGNLADSGKTLAEMQTLIDAKQAALTAGDNITISGSTISAKGGLLPTIIVTVPSGSSVTCTDGVTTLSGTSTGTVTFSVPNFGIWSISASLSGQSASGSVTVDTVKQYALELAYAKIYGVSWNGGSSTVWSRTDDAAAFADPVPAVSNGTGSSPFDNCYPWNGMVKENRTGGVMVKIPKYWFKWTKSGSTLKLQIADKAVSGFSVSPAHMDRGDGAGERDYVYVGKYHCNSSYLSATGSSPVASITRSSARSSIHAKGSTIWQFDYAMRYTIWMLYLVEFANTNSQACIGYGCGGGSAVGAVGYTDSMQYHTGTTQASRTTYGLGTQYRYIEGILDNVFDWMDGCYYSSAGMSVIKNPANFSDTANGTVIGTPTSGCPSAMSLSTVSGFEWCIYPTAAAGSTTTYFPDYWNFDTSSPCLFSGGSYVQGLNCGMFYVGCYGTSGTGPNIGCRLQELP